MREDVIFATDIDNTLIHSYKRKPDGGVCVEKRGDKELSYMSREAFGRLRALSNECLIVPVTTRSVEQYRRLDLGIDFRYALVAHGAVLLVDGEPDSEWSIETRNAFPADLPTLAHDGNIHDIRCVENSFLFMKANDTAKAVLDLNEKNPRYDIFSVHNKVYVFPKGFDKGVAVKRLRSLLSPQIIIGAGDSRLDVPLLDNADIAVALDDAGVRPHYIAIRSDADGTLALLNTVFRIAADPAAVSPPEARRPGQS
jgi:hydroxymethylpyrimidine pyrophosphatase-like HAD family hydrolase